jgi:hypothetical protein
LLLQRCGVERTGNESLFEPIREAIEEIERRKAAGEWPAAGGMRADVRL